MVSAPLLTRDLSAAYSKPFRGYRLNQSPIRAFTQCNSFYLGRRVDSRFGPGAPFFNAMNRHEATA